MSWFDTAKIATMATKAMKEAQKTLDTALDIKEEGDEESSPQESSWSNWKLPNSESDSKLASSLWGSFSGSYMESSSVGSEPEVVTAAPVSRGSQMVSSTSDSVLAGVPELEPETEEKFAGSRLDIVSGESESVSEPMMQSVELESPQSPVVSIEIISPDTSSPSSDIVEVLTPPPPPSLDTSGSTADTVVDTDMQARLEEAMVESEKKSVSSKSSELVLVSDTTSSDIEVLEGSGHTRNSSDQSQVSSEETTEVLRRRNRELSEVVAARESRLVAVSREIGELQEESGQMAVRLEAALEELQTERSSRQDLEQRTRVEREQISLLKKELAKVQQTLETKGGDDQEKDEIISDLRAEGEALSKQNGKLAETIRKLRAKEKSHDGEVTKLKTDLEKNVSEVERLRKSLSAKTGLEESQIETIKSLTDANKAWETESKKLKTDLEDNVEKVLGLRSSLEGAYREMAEMKRKLEEAAGEAAAAALSKEVSLKEAAMSELEEERRRWEVARQRLELQNASLQDSLRLSEVSVAEREEACRRELDTMRHKLAQSDRRQEEMTDCVSEATRPLLRQIETLQASMREVRGVGEKVEQSLGERLQLATQSLAHAQERERGLQERLQELGVKEATSEEKVRLERERRGEAEATVEELREKLRGLEERSVKERQQSEVERKCASEELEELQRERDFLTASLNTEKAESEGRKKKCLNLLEQLKDRDRRVKELQAEVEASGRASVTSMGRSVSASPSPSLTSDTSWHPGNDEVRAPPLSPPSHINCSIPGVLQCRTDPLHSFLLRHGQVRLEQCRRAGESRGPAQTEGGGAGPAAAGAGGAEQAQGKHEQGDHQAHHTGRTGGRNTGLSQTFLFIFVF